MMDQKRMTSRPFRFVLRLVEVLVVQSVRLFDGLFSGEPTPTQPTPPSTSRRSSQGGSVVDTGANFGADTGADFGVGRTGGLFL